MRIAVEMAIVVKREFQYAGKGEMRGELQVCSASKGNSAFWRHSENDLAINSYLIARATVRDS